MNSSTVSAEIGLRLITTPLQIVPLTGSLFNSRQDPYAVRIAFHVGLEEPVEWIFARDLLSRGIQGRQGIGDVRVRPSPGPSARGHKKSSRFYDGGSSSRARGSQTVASIPRTA